MSDSKEEYLRLKLEQEISGEKLLQSMRDTMKKFPLINSEKEGFGVWGGNDE